MNELEDIRAAVLAEARAARPSPSWGAQSLGLVGLSALAVSVSLAAASLLELGPVEVRWTGALFALTVVGAAIAGLRPRSRRMLAGAGLLAVGGVVSHIVVAVMRGSAPGWFVEPGCALAQVGVSLVPWLATLWVFTRFAYRPLSSFMGGIGAAACGMLVLDLTCHVPGAFHTAMFHVLPMFVIAALLAIARSRARTLSHVP